MGPHLLVLKAADESDSTTTVQNDDHFVVAIGINETWLMRYVLRIASTGDFKFAFTFPTSGAISGMTTGPTLATFLATSSPSTPVTVFTGTGTGSLHIVELMYINGGTAGNLQLQWACNSAGTATVKQNSTLWGLKLA